MSQLEALVDGHVGEAPEPALVVVGKDMTVVDEAQEIIGTALFPLRDALHFLLLGLAPFDVGAGLHAKRKKRITQYFLKCQENKYSVRL